MREEIINRLGDEGISYSLDITLATRKFQKYSAITNSFKRDGPVDTFTFKSLKGCGAFGSIPGA